MNMGLGSNAGLYFEDVQASTLSRHSISFNSSTVDNTWDMWNRNGMDDLSSVVKPMRSNSDVLSDSGLSQGWMSSGSFIPDGNLGLKHDTGLAVEWSVEEQYTLERSLDKYKDEPSIIKYIRIAAALPEKTVRDVALRCRWMTRKRRKYEEHYSGKKVTNRKDKSMASCPKPGLPPAKPFNMFTVTHSPLMQQCGQSGLTPLDASCESVKRCLQQNFEAFDQISKNMSSYKFQENIELFRSTKNNMTNVLNEMGQLPGLPQLPVTINQNLLKFLMPDVNQHLQKRDGLAKYTHLKQDSRS